MLSHVFSGLAAHASRTERRAEAAERELTKVKLLEFLQDRIGETFTGVITGVQEFGVFVESPDLLIDGLVHITKFTDDRYRFDRKRWALVGDHRHRLMRVGSLLEVRIAAINIPRRQLDLEPVEPPPDAAAPRKGRKADKAGGKADQRARKAEKPARKAGCRDRKDARRKDARPDKKRPGRRQGGRGGGRRKRR